LLYNQSYGNERLERKWFETERNNAFLEKMRIGRFNLRRLTVALAPSMTAEVKSLASDFGSPGGLG
jgi:hypothetical protein